MSVHTIRQERRKLRSTSRYRYVGKMTTNDIRTQHVRTNHSRILESRLRQSYMGMMTLDHTPIVALC